MLRRCVLALCLVPILGVAPVAQGIWPNGRNHSPSPQEIHREKELEKQRTKQRYRDLRHDTDKLLALANQLKQQVDAAGEEKLSLDVIKKAEEIEKLAKSVKNKMRGD